MEMLLEEDEEIDVYNYVGYASKNQLERIRNFQERQKMRNFEDQI